MSDIHIDQPHALSIAEVHQRLQGLGLSDKYGLTVSWSGDRASFTNATDQADATLTGSIAILPDRVIIDIDTWGAMMNLYQGSIQEKVTTGLMTVLSAPSTQSPANPIDAYAASQPQPPPTVPASDPPAQAAAPPVPRAAGPVLRRGSRGPQVSALQQRLSDLGFDTGGVDGDFGARTLAAVRAFQGQSQLPADGVVGPQTRAALWPDAQSAPTPQPPPVGPTVVLPRPPPYATGPQPSPPPQAAHRPAAPPAAGTTAPPAAASQVGGVSPASSPTQKTGTGAPAPWWNQKYVLAGGLVVSGMLLLLLVLALRKPHPPALPVGS